MNVICLSLSFLMTIIPQDSCSGTSQRSDIRVTYTDGNI